VTLDNYEIFCRVCGVPFNPARIDSLTCSAACRQALWRGRDLAYLRYLPAAERRKQRRWHAKHERAIAAVKHANILNRAARAQRAAAKKQRRAEMLERIHAEAVGRFVLAEERRRKRQNVGMAVHRVLRLFTQQQRPITEDSIADFLITENGFMREDIVAAIAEARADGSYDHITSGDFSGFGG
jgi:hypothetical protein